MSPAPTMAPRIDPPVPPQTADTARAQLQEATDRLAALTRELADATRRAGEFFARETPSDEAAIHAHRDEITRAHWRQSLAVQSLQRQMAPRIDPPAPPQTADTARAQLQEATDRLAALTRELADATRRAGEFFARETPSDEAAIHAHRDEITRAYRRQSLAVQALQGQLEQAKYAEQQRAAATLDEQLAQGLARCEELGRDTAVLVRMYDEQLLGLFEILAQLADVDEEGLKIKVTFARHGRVDDWVAAMPIPPGVTAYGERLHEHAVFTQIPRGEEIPDGRVRFHHFAEWRRDHRARTA